MYRIIGGDGREYGPVSLEQVQLWIAQRRAGPGTQVRSETATEWSALDQLPEFAADLAALQPRVDPPPFPVAPPPLPADAAAQEAVDEVRGNAVGDVPVASVPEPGSASAATTSAEDPLDAASYIQRCLARRYDLRIRASISRGYDIAARQVWLLMFALVLTAMIQFAIGRLPLVRASVFALEGIFDGGLALFCVALARGGVATLGDVFAGFRIQFSQLLLFSLGRSMLLLALAGVTVVPVLVLLGVAGDGSMDPRAAVSALMLSPFFALPAVYLLVSWTFVPFLIIDRELGFWDAMELSRRVVKRRWFKLLFLHLAFLPIHLAGLMAFGVGVIYTAALKRATLAGIYDEVFRE